MKKTKPKIGRHTYLDQLSKETGVGYHCLVSRWYKGKRGKELTKPSRPKVDTRKYCGFTLNEWAVLIKNGRECYEKLDSHYLRYFFRKPANKDKSDAEVMQIIFDHYGFKYKVSDFLIPENRNKVKKFLKEKQKTHSF